MKDGKKYSYDEILELLRNSNYTAPDVWGHIETELDLTSQLKELPQYKAPDNLWEGIEAELGEPTPVTTPVNTPVITAQATSKYSTLKLLALGVLIGIFSLASIQYLIKNNKGQEYQYKSEVEMASLISNKIELDDNVNEVVSYIRENSFLFNQEQLEEFNTQLEEINKALEQLIDMQEKYGLDASSNKLMAKIERDRATLLKTMIANT